MATYMVFVGSKASFVTEDMRKAKKAYRKTPTAVSLDGKIVHQTVTLWKDSVTIGAK